jgi:hypothetical protein
MGLQCKRELQGVQWEGEGKQRGYGGVKRIKVCYLYMHGDNIKKPINCI